MKRQQLLQLAALFLCSAAVGGNCKIEAEKNPSGSSAWKIKKMSGASGGAVISASGAHRLPELMLSKLDVRGAGKYRIWVRFYAYKDKKANFYLLVRDRNDIGVAFKKFDFFPRLPTTKPYESGKKINRAEGFIWKCMDVSFENSASYSLNIGSLVSRGPGSPRMIDCMVVTQDDNYSPERDGTNLVESIQLGSESHKKVPVGFQPGKNYQIHTSFFSGIKNPVKQFSAGLIQNGVVFLDPGRIVTLGFNRDHGRQGDSAKGFLTMSPVGRVYRIHDRQFSKNHPAPLGRFVNSEGHVGRIYSASYDPVIAQQLKECADLVKKYAPEKGILKWSICAEFGGWLDYSKYSIEKYRNWLKKRYANITELNSKWNTSYNNFNEVVPAKSADENKVAWFDFREFCGEYFAKVVADQVPVVNKNDPQGRMCTTQLSNLDLLAARFTAMRPMDWEYMIKVGLKGTDNIGWDSYCADDYMGCEVDLLDSISLGKKLINQEWNVHSTDPRIAARSYWTMVGKGVKGIYIFQLQEGTHHDSYPKWAVLNNDFTPKKKLGAYADAVQEVHRFEPLLMSAKREYPVKPVALYYSRLDLSLQKRPLACTWGEQIDTPYRVYALLRGLGYPVRWITPKQIKAGGLKDVGAVVFIEANHIPRQAADKVAQWVKSGGVVIGDQWPGICDRYGKTQLSLLNIFGIRPEAVKGKNKKGQLALQESSQGYGEETIGAINQENLYSSVAEIWQQWDAEHPVARKVGNFMFSGYGKQNVKCIDGEVIGMTFKGKPGVIVNDVGKGHALYVSAMLGSLYGGSATRYEWDPEHSSNSPARLFDAFLKYSGVKPFSKSSLNWQLAAKLRVEIPLIDPENNFFIGLTNFDESKLPDFKLTLVWPDSWSLPHNIYMTRGGSRELCKVNFIKKDGNLVLNIKGFDSHASLIGVRNMQPVIALDFSNARRTAAGLMTISPSQEVNCKATVYNLSDKTLQPGTLSLFLPRGWFNDKSQTVIPAIKPWGSASAEFKIKASPIASDSRLKPVTFKYANKSITATPSTEMIWWGQAKGK